MHLKKHLAGQRHSDDDEAKTTVKQWLSNQAASFFDDSMQKLFPRYDKCLNSNDWLTNKSINEHFHERLLCSDNEHFQERFFLDNEHIFGVDQGDTPEIMDEILTTARDMELEVNEDDIEELIMGHEDELTTEELQEILNEEHQETQRNVSPSEQEEDERGPMPTSAIKDLLKKWEDVRLIEY
ncbi:hypothetical protein TNCV_3968741 [Trichonephila clavipes]|nr:hypothetical protein TNCV_3968741 [Trichonephila clavipes]